MNTERQAGCANCNGLGHLKDQPKDRCPICEGTGRVRATSSTQKPLSVLLVDREWTRKDVQRIWSEAPADRYDAVKDAHNSETAALVKALRKSCERIGYFSDLYCGMNDMTGRNALEEIAAILNQDEKRDKDLGKRGAAI